jgi:AsmA-like C-terminal region
LVGKTTITGTLSGAFTQGGPTLSGNIATALLHLSDIVKLSSINAVYQANVDQSDADVFNYSKVWETLFIDLQTKVAKIAGGGGASNIQGRVTYLAGVIGLNPVTMTFLGGKASAIGKIDTTGAENNFALKGRVDNMQIGAVLRELKSSYPVSGALQLSYDLTGAGNTKGQIPRSLNGNLSMSLRNGWLGTGLLDLAGVSLPAWLLTRVPGGNQANLVCAVAPFRFGKGKGTTQGLVLETYDVQVVGVGLIDFRQSELNLRFKPQALRPQFVKIAQPFAIRGPLSHPQLRLTGAPVAGAVVEVFAFPLNLLETIVQPQANELGRIPCHITYTASASASGPLGLGILGPNSPVLRPPRLGASGGPLGLGILNRPPLGGYRH